MTHSTDFHLETLAVHAGIEPDPQTGGGDDAHLPDIDLCSARRGTAQRVRLFSFRQPHAHGPAQCPGWAGGRQARSGFCLWHGSD